jgi:hypothetical protein
MKETHTNLSGCSQSNLSMLSQGPVLGRGDWGGNISSDTQKLAALEGLPRWKRTLHTIERTESGALENVKGVLEKWQRPNGKILSLWGVAGRLGVFECIECISTGIKVPGRLLSRACCSRRMRSGRRLSLAQPLSRRGVMRRCVCNWEEQHRSNLSYIELYVSQQMHSGERTFINGVKSYCLGFGLQC